jgi:uncharacterized protein
MKITHAMVVLALAGTIGWAASASPTTPQTSQPIEERAAQNALPKAEGQVWNTLLGAKISYSAKAPHITATLTPDIKALNGETVTVNGFMLPMDGAEYSTHFLLSKRTPTCFYCPPGEPNEVIEVFAKKGIRFDDAMLSMTGTFELTNNTENGIFFVMKNATGDKLGKNWVIPLMEKNLP